MNYAGQGFPMCYDGHDGSDFMLLGGFDTMDRGSARIVAAAAGVVVRAVDGNYDRCHSSVATMDVDCDGHEMRANQVVLEHWHGWRTIYAHFKEGSVRVAEGDVVQCGQFLGLVGSSGYSSGPHLHFEVQVAEGESIDPFAGPHSQEQSYWVEQDAGDGLPGDLCDPAWSVAPPQ